MGDLCSACTRRVSRQPVNERSYRLGSGLVDVRNREAVCVDRLGDGRMAELPLNDLDVDAGFAQRCVP